MSELVLYGDKFYISPYVLSAFVALEEKGLPYRYVPVSLGDKEQHAASFAASITSRVPALQHGDFWLAESSAIVEYLDDAFPETWRALPTSPKEKARARQVMAWIRSDLMPIREERSTHTIFYEHTDKALSKEGEAARTKLLRAAETLVPSKGFLFGEFTVADADLGLMLQRLASNGDELTARLREYVAHVWTRPSVDKFVRRARPAYVPY